MCLFVEDKRTPSKYHLKIDSRIFSYSKQGVKTGERLKKEDGKKEEFFFNVQKDGILPISGRLKSLTVHEHNPLIIVVNSGLLNQVNR